MRRAFIQNGCPVGVGSDVIVGGTVDRVTGIFSEDVDPKAPYQVCVGGWWYTYHYEIVELCP